MDTTMNVTMGVNQLDSTGVVMPTGLLSAVNALCNGGDNDGDDSYGTIDGSNCDNDSDDNDNHSNINDYDNNENHDNDDNKSSNIYGATYNVYNNINSNNVASKNNTFKCQLNAPSFSHDDYYSNDQRNHRNSPSSTNVQHEVQKQHQNTFKSESQLATFPGVTVPPVQRIDVATYTIQASRVVLIPDLYKAVRQAGGTCSPLRAQLNKLSIVPKRFDPFQMIRLKHVGALGLEVKCCSFILLDEFLQVISKYKDKNVAPEAFNILPSVDVTTPAEVKDLKFTFPSGGIHKVSAAASTVSTLHTFIVDDQVVVCFVELQQIFEALFGNVFLMSLSKLDICSRKFTALQIDEVMDFVDIDEANLSSAGFFVIKKDAERIFQYAEALFNVDKLEIKWLEPLRLSSADNQQNPDKLTRRKDSSSSSNSKSAVSSTFSGAREMSSEIQEASSFEPKVVERINRPDSAKFQEATGCVETIPGNFFLDSDKDVVLDESNRHVLNLGCKGETPQQKARLTPENTSQENEIGSSLGKIPEFCKEISQKDDACDAKAQKPQPTTGSSAIDLTSFEDQDAMISSPDMNSLQSDPELDPCSSICTFIIDGEEVVCIPDIHKIIIHLYGQSVQVGYYLQRLQIPTQRFSTMHVKRLKALNALNSKATLCTYILKSDALRLVKMYDVFCNESKMQQIQWNGPVSLEGVQTAKLPSDESIFHQKPTPSMACMNQEPIEVVKIPTFLIDGEIVVSVPDAHKIVQVLNGQSVQVRYNMDKLGIIKRRYSYSQVYQLRAISDLKRPSMCTFITKSDADTLLQHYLTAENIYRLQFIHWIAPIHLGERRGRRASHTQDSTPLDEINTDQTSQYDVSCCQANQGQETHCSDDVSLDSLPSSGEVRHKSIDESNERCLENVECSMPSTTVEASGPQTITSPQNQIPVSATLATAGQIPGEVTTATAASKTVEVSMTTGVQNSEKITIAANGPIPGKVSMETVSQIAGVTCMETDSPIPCRVVMATSSSLPCGEATAGGGTIPCGVAMATGTSELPCNVIRADSVDVSEVDPTGHYSREEHGRKRTYDTIKENDSISLEMKRLKDEKSDIAANLERKETEMKILHDAYQQQVACERKRRLEVEREVDELKASNTDLCKTLQRKESEMKILHDSYQYQIRKEREKIQELENELTDLRGSVAFASGVSIPDIKIKQERPF